MSIKIFSAEQYVWLTGVTVAVITGRGSIVTTILKLAPWQLGGPTEVGVTV
jgi:hypothetical protein